MTATRQPANHPAGTAAEEAVRRAAAGTDSPAVITVRRTGGSVSADAVTLDPDTVDRHGLPTVLHAIALGMPKYPGLFDDVYGYAIALPDHDVAYLRTTDGTSTIAIGPHPRDDPRQRDDLIHALDALVDSGPGNRGANAALR